MAKKYDSPELESIFNLTLKLGGIDPMTVKRSYSAHRYWAVAEKIWKNAEKQIGCNVMYTVLFHIHWGCYPVDSPTNADFFQLVELAEAEFLKHTNEMEIAKSKSVFKRAYAAVMNSQSPYVMKNCRWCSFEHRGFLENRTLFKLYGGEVVVHSLNLVTVSRADLDSMIDKAQTRYKYERFKHFIEQLLPCAAAWTDAEWSDHRNIIDHMKNAFGVDYSDAGFKFDRLIGLICAIEDWQINLGDILAVSHFGEDMARLLWPTYWEAIVEELFVFVYSCYKKFASEVRVSHEYSDEDLVIMREEIMNNWVFKIVFGWYQSEIYDFSTGFRKMLFDILLGAH